MNNLIENKSHDIEVVKKINILNSSKLKLLYIFFDNDIINEITALEHVYFKIMFKDKVWLKYIFFNKRIYRSYYLVLYNKSKKYLAPIKYRNKNETKQLVVFINNNSDRLI
jgi:hypothetical protein